MLRGCVAHLSLVNTCQLAVVNADNNHLFLDHNNSGENSFYQLGEQMETFKVAQTTDPSALPRAGILRIGAEGSEWDIPSRLPRIDYSLIRM